MLTQQTKVYPVDKHNSKVIGKCPWCHNSWTVIVPTKGLVSWQMGELVQNVLSELPLSDRELLISGICSECWDKMGERINYE